MVIIRKLWWISLFLWMLFPDSGYAVMPMKIILITDDNQQISATLEDNPTARDFYQQLPMTLELRDYGAKEKVTDLPKKLTKENAPIGHTPLKGQIAYFAPWNNFVIYRDNASYYPGIIHLGQIETNFSLINHTGKMKIRIQSVP